MYQSEYQICEVSPPLYPDEHGMVTNSSRSLTVRGQIELLGKVETLSSLPVCVLYSPQQSIRPHPLPFMLNVQ